MLHNDCNAGRRLSIEPSQPATTPITAAQAIPTKSRIHVKVEEEPCSKRQRSAPSRLVESPEKKPKLQKLTNAEEPLPPLPVPVAPSDPPPPPVPCIEAEYSAEEDDDRRRPRLANSSFFHSLTEALGASAAGGKGRRWAWSAHLRMDDLDLTDLHAEVSSTNPHIPPLESILCPIETVGLDAEEEEEEEDAAPAPVRKQPRRSLPLQERTGADSPHGITHGITLRGAQLTHAILLGHKKVENRHFAMKPGWYALHTGAKASAHESQHALLAAITPRLPDEMALPHSSIVGAIRISHALTLEQCAHAEPWAFGPVVNVIDQYITLERPIPHRGALSVWRVGSEVVEELRSQLLQGTVHENGIQHLPPPSAQPERMNVKKLAEAAQGYAAVPRAAPQLSMEI